MSKFRSIAFITLCTILVCSGCTVVEHTNVIVQDKDYAVLNPVGVQTITAMNPISPRLDKLAGKTIWVSQPADSPVMKALLDRLAADYPQTTWKQKISTDVAPAELTADELTSADALIQGVATAPATSWKQAEYVAKLEQQGIPTVLIEYSDQYSLVLQSAAAYGCLNIRIVDCPQTEDASAAVASFFNDLITSLTTPLTDKEKSSEFVSPEQPRIMFTGTLDEAQDFFQVTDPLRSAYGAPIARWTDGFPVAIPTEERVKQMLSGTSHSPGEVLKQMADSANGKKGDPVVFAPDNVTTIVEKIAINAVMAGCRPEYLPVVLAQACSGCPAGSTVFASEWSCVSGPIAKEIGMNYGTAMLDPGNQANATIGRAYQLITLNIAGFIPGVFRLDSQGNPMNLGGTCFAENADGIPAGWLGLNEESGYKKDQSVIMVSTSNSGEGATGGDFSPSSYRALQATGTGGVADRLGVLGQPGPHNFLEYYIPGIYANKFGGRTFVMVSEMANDLKNYGFKSKAAVYDWLWQSSFITMDQFRKYGWYDFRTNGGNYIEPTSGKAYKDLPGDYKVPAMGYKPFENCIIVAGGNEEVCLVLGYRDSTYPIDPWR